MAQKCRVCAHRNTEEIENDIVRGTPHTAIGKKYGIHFQSVRYHAEHHLPEKLVQAAEEKEVNHAETILDGIHTLLEKSRGILQQAETEGQKTTALAAIKEMRGIYELLSKIAVKMHEYQQTHAEGGNAPRTLADLYDEERNEMKNLDVLSDEELRVFIQLQSKIAGTIPADDRDENTRMFVDSMNSIEADNNINNNNNSDPNSPRNGSSQHKNSLKSKNKTSSKMVRTKLPDEPEPEFVELDDLDLELDDLSNDKKVSPPSSNTIPSEETDPKWMRKWRDKHPSRFYRPD